MHKALNLTRRFSFEELRLRNIKEFGLYKFDKLFNYAKAYSSCVNKAKITLISNKTYTFKLSKMETQQKLCEECKGPLLDDNSPDNRKVI